ncbi:unnamed protein product [marine sediment metagenome]|uniref:Uncharacterized protein n=1 Tax=marine sediment metagenome TaxID=412755 RepID=X1VRX6_9ZZZZ
MSDSENPIDRELFLEKFEKLSLKIEQLTSEISKMKEKLDKTNKFNRSFGLEALRNSKPLGFAREIHGIKSPTKRYILSIRTVSELWKGRKNDFLIAIRQQEKQTQKDLKALGIRIPIDDMKNLTTLAREVLSMLYISSELKGIEITEILREMISQINKEGQSMVREVKQNMVL